MSICVVFPNLFVRLHEKQATQVFLNKSALLGLMRATRQQPFHARAYFIFSICLICSAVRDGAKGRPVLRTSLHSHSSSYLSTSDLLLCISILHSLFFGHFPPSVVACLPSVHEFYQLPPTQSFSALKTVTIGSLIHALQRCCESTAHKLAENK